MQSRIKAFRTLKIRKPFLLREAEIATLRGLFLKRQYQYCKYVYIAVKLLVFRHEKYLRRKFNVFLKS